MVFTACGEGGGDDFQPLPSPEDTASSDATPDPSPSESRTKGPVPAPRTGVDEVDATLQLLNAGDVDALQARLHTYEEECLRDNFGLPCAPGEPVGTIAEVLATNYCPESRPLRVDQFAERIQDYIQPGLDFVGLLEPVGESPSHLRRSSYLVVWKAPQLYWALYLADDGGIVALGASCDLGTALPQADWQQIAP